MKILVVVPDLNLGGVTSSAINFCKECSRRGNHVDILVMNGANANINNVNQIFLSGQSLFWNLNSKQISQYAGLSKLLLYALGGIKKITNRLGLWLPIIFRNFRLKGDYDVAIAYRQCAPCYYFTLNCVFAQKKISMIHGNLNFMGDISSWDKYFTNFDKIACVSDAVGRDFKQKYKSIANKFITIYNMFDEQEILRKGNLASHIHVDQSTINIITVSRHDNGHKKVNRVIETCVELRKQGYDNFHWYIVGDGPDYQYNFNLAHEQGVSDLITFCGAMDNPFALQAQCDFSVITSATESFGMSVVESQILCKPIIAMRYPGINEVIMDGNNGIVAEQTLTSLIEKMKLLIGDSQFRATISKNLKDRQYNNDKAYFQFIDAATK